MNQRSSTPPIAPTAFSITNLPRAFRLTLMGVIALFVAHVGFDLFAPVSADLRIAVHDVLVVLEGAAASAALFYAAKCSAPYSRRHALAWGLLGAATTSYMLGDAIWTVIEVGLKQDPFPSLADAGYLPYYPLFIAGILLLPKRRLSRHESLKLLLDMGVVTIASMLVYRTFLFAPIIEHAEDPFTFIVTLAYPALDLVLLWGVIVLLLRQTQQLQIPLLLLAGSALCLTFADSFFNYQSAAGIYESGSSFIDPLYVASLLLAVLAGVLEGSIQQRMPSQDAEIRAHATASLARSRNTSKWVYLVLPYFWIAIAYALLLWEHKQEHAQFHIQAASTDFLFNAVGVGLIIVFVLARQLVMLRENEHLSSDLTRLLDASQILASPLQINQLPGLIQTELHRLIAFDLVSIWVAQDKTTLVAFKNGVSQSESQDAPAVTLHISGVIKQLLEANQPTLFSYSSADVVADDALPRQLFHPPTPEPVLPASPMSASPMTSSPLSWIVTPLITNDRRVGLLAIGHAQANAYEQTHANLLTAFANQAAAAIENAQLRRQEAAAAAAAERARLARELHDSVSQALFGISLGTRTTRQLITTDAKKAIASTDYVLNLTDGALAEMRALIFELRPENLVTEGLLVALQKQVTALCKRHNLDARITATPGEPMLPIEAKEALYRITLEALQNTIKHAHASQVHVVLTSYADAVLLEVCDNGKGFVTSVLQDGHYGLISMRERAERCGAIFEAESGPGQGTTVRVRVPNQTHILEGASP
jgi:signal transduction histidine kinase